MSIIDLAAAKQERQPHWTGEAYCTGCRHIWAAVAPVSTNWIECPSCRLPKGTPRYPFSASDGDLLLQCEPCGGDALYAYKRSGNFFVKCMGCGNDLTEAFYDG